MAVRSAAVLLGMWRTASTAKCLSAKGVRTLLHCLQHGLQEGLAVADVGVPQAIIAC